jgi:hypothetical protein
MEIHVNRLAWVSILIAIVPMQLTNAADQSPTPRDTSRVVCDPLNAKKTDKISLGFPVPHGDNLAIINPAGTYFFIAFDQPDAGSPVQPIISGPDFSRMSNLDLDVANARGINWSRKNATKEPIFTRSGSYKVLVGASLETEDPILDGWCHVRIKLQ